MNMTRLLISSYKSRRSLTAEKGCRGEAGFTLVEMLAVLVIIAVLAAAAVPSMAGFINKAKKDRYIAEARAACTALSQYLNEKEAKGGYTDRELYEEVQRYPLGDPRNSLTALTEGSCTEGARIVNILFLYDILDGIEYEIDSYTVHIYYNNKVMVEENQR